MNVVSVEPMRCLFAYEGLLRIDRIAAGVGIIIFSPTFKTAAGIHVIRGKADTPDPPNPAYFADTGIDSILHEFSKRKITPPYSVAIAGGATMLDAPPEADIGKQVIAVVKGILSKQDLPIKKESLGGNSIRSLILNVEDRKLQLVQYKVDPSSETHEQL